MASFFVDSAGSNTAPYDTWAKAATSLATAVAATTAAGDVIYVANTHSFAAGGTAITYTPPAGVTNLAIICVTPSGGASHSGWVTTPSGQEACGAGAVALTFAAIAAGNVFIHGMKFIAGTTSSASADMSFNVSGSINLSRLECQKCQFTLNNSNTGSQFVMGAVAGNPQRWNVQRYIDCTFETLTARAGNLFLLQGADIEMVNPTFTIAAGTQPALIFTSTNGPCGSLVVRDGDISGLAPSTAIVDRASLVNYRVLFKGCTTSSSAFTGGTQANGAGVWQMRQCSNADQIYDFHYETPYGAAVESTSTYANDGPTFNGTNLSWQITTSSLCHETRPFILPIQTVWNTVTSAQTASVEYARDNATLLTKREAWIDLAYPSSTTRPITDNLDSRYGEPFDATNTATAGTSGSASGWTESLTNNGFQKFSVSFTAAEVGLVECRFFITVASDVSYIDPQLRIA